MTTTNMNTTSQIRYYLGTSLNTLQEKFCTPQCPPADLSGTAIQKEKLYRATDGLCISGCEYIGTDPKYTYSGTVNTITDAAFCTKICAPVHPTTPDTNIALFSSPSDLLYVLTDATCTATCPYAYKL
jgi:hypothetical protein